MGGDIKTYVSLTKKTKPLEREKRIQTCCGHAKKKGDFQDFLSQFNYIVEQNTSVKILSVNSGKKKKRNANSMVLKVSQKYSFLIPGDAEKGTWGAIDDDKELKSDVLLLSHHGACTNGSTSKELLEKIQPRVCLISAGFQHGHPDIATIKCLQNYYKTKKYYTTPHFLTYCEGCPEGGKKIKFIVTNFPIFTTIDNGKLSVNLGRDPLKVKLSRNFWPCPGVSFDDGAGGELHFEADEKCTVLKKLPQGQALSSCSNIFKKGNDYFYKFEEAYFSIEPEYLT